MARQRSDAHPCEACAACYLGRAQARSRVRDLNRRHQRCVRSFGANPLGALLALLIGAGAAPVQGQKTPDDLDPAKASPPHQMKPSTSPVRRKTVAAKM